jgi:hypothetical protein
MFMKKIIVFLLSLTIVLFFNIGCKKKESSPTSSKTPITLSGTFKTNGIYQYRSGRGCNSTWTFANNNYNYNVIWFRWDTIASQWISEGAENMNGTYSDDNNFLRLTDKYGAYPDDGYKWHYSIDGNKLTLNSAWDEGGIFAGSSNTLVGTWTEHISYYDTTAHTFNTSTRNVIYNQGGTAMEIYISSGYTDTTRFNYVIAGDVLTQYYQGSSWTYVGIYSIKQNKLYLYGKPGTSENDSYTQIDYFKQ